MQPDPSPTPRRETLLAGLLRLNVKFRRHSTHPARFVSLILAHGILT